MASVSGMASGQPLWIRPAEHPPSASSGLENGGHHYLVAGTLLVSASPLPELSAFAAPSALTAPLVPELDAEPAGGSTPSPQDPLQVFDGKGLLARGSRRVRCTVSSGEHRVEVRGCGSLELSSSGRELRYRLEPGAGDEIRAELLLGPGLILALALRDVFCLHASAVASDGRGAVFAGDSGRGKSTLAARLGGLPGITPVADDVLPVSAAAGEALPWFPQLKLSPQAQFGVAQPPRLPLGALFLLAGGPHCRTVEVCRLSPRLGGEALLRHTIAARLFSPPLLARHFEYLFSFAQRLPIFTLRYPWRSDALEEVAAVVRQSLDPAASSTASEARPDLARFREDPPREHLGLQSRQRSSS
ncbi:MAG: hypothetical protein SX243_05940 [Acidobacteriota bacterium]|nr:hypothetical protein [Acidobacteriota bacterium]